MKRTSKAKNTSTDTRKPYKVCAYNFTTFTKVVSEESGADLKTIANKTQTAYFRDYFNDLSAATFIVERDYIDKDYLEDYSAYYVRCFHKYKRECTRLHFFRKKFKQSDFAALLNGEKGVLSKDWLNDSYLGFIVIKPLPETVFGRTCLIVYDDNDERKFPIVRNYPANLYGIGLVVRCTLAFQEQDSVVGTCATSALWTTFQGTGKLFQHRIPSPVEIAKSAENAHNTADGKVLGSSNVKPEMMFQAINDLGLDVYSKSVIHEHDFLMNNIYAYLNCGIPILLGVYLFDTTLPEDDERYQIFDKHVVAVTGYRLGKHEASVQNENGLLQRATRINKIYVHDDQIGPFSRMELDGKKTYVPVPGIEKKCTSFKTTYKNNEGKIKGIRAVPIRIIIPLYHKIRIHYETIEYAILVFNGILKNIFRDTFEWDITLTTVNNFKSKLFTTGSSEYVLAQNLPHFLWVATAYTKDQRVMDFVFDATDIKQGSLFVFPVFYDDDVKKKIISIFSETDFEKILEPDGYRVFRYSTAWHIVKWFRENN